MCRCRRMRFSSTPLLLLFCDNNIFQFFLLTVKVELTVDFDEADSSLF